MQIAALRHRVTALRDPRADDDTCRARQLCLGRHGQVVVERETQRQVAHALAKNGQRHARTLDRTCEHEHRVVGTDPILEPRRKLDHAADARHDRGRGTIDCRRRCVSGWHPRQLPRLGDAAADLPRIAGVTAFDLDQPFPQAHGSLVVATVEGRSSSQGQRLGIVGIELEGTLDESRRLALELAALGHRQRVGVVGEQVRIVGTRAQRLPEGIDGLRVLAEHDLRAGEHQPAVTIVGPGLQTFGELVDHRRDLFRHQRMRGDGRIAGRRVGLGVAGTGQH